jgi:hypothetical protein
MDRPDLSGLPHPRVPPGFRFTDWASSEFKGRDWAAVYNAGFVDDWGFYPAPAEHLLALFAEPGVLPELQHLVIDDSERPVALLITQVSRYNADESRNQSATLSASRRFQPSDVGVSPGRFLRADYDV